MVGEKSFQEYDWKIIFGVGTLVGTLLTVLSILLISPQGVGNVPADISGSDPAYALRLIQAIGILLPLFTGLLRLTTSEYAEVGQDINKYLFIGILLLVVGGSIAVAGGLTADMAGVLRTALVFVLLTFVMIAIVAGLMFRKMPTEEGSPEETSGETGNDENCQTPDNNGTQNESKGQTPEKDGTEPAQAETKAEDAATDSEQADDTDSEQLGDGSEQL
ncbi:hypothetical protein [Halorussus lipolyticus]|uniref:hypothetical protein n=1 Tax=Halorussus lipolyticus TaxID=3034024 RepID=UPI0023E89EB1|nr:hypothetical protein [Halorussus sp. DT80]